LSEYFHLYCFAAIYNVCFFGAWYINCSTEFRISTY
jgi:hypothetical protein